MAALVAANVCRYTINGTYAGRPIANVLDMAIVDDVGSFRTDNILAQAQILVQAWIDHILENVSNNYAANSISWVDLNTEEGTVGSTTLGVTNNFPQNGGGADAPMPGNVAMRVNKSIAAQRGQRQGRMYLVGVPESNTEDATPNTLNAASIAAVNVDLALFLPQINVETADPEEFVSTLVVVHTEDQSAPPHDPPDIVVTGASIVNTLVVDATLSSQRRRLRG